MLFAIFAAKTLLLTQMFASESLGTMSNSGPRSTRLIYTLSEATVMVCYRLVIAPHAVNARQGTLRLNHIS